SPRIVTKSAQTGADFVVTLSAWAEGRRPTLGWGTAWRLGRRGHAYTGRHEAAARRRPAGPGGRGGAGPARDQGVDDDRRAPANVSGRRGRAADLPPLPSMRTLRRSFPRASDHGREAPPARPTRGDRSLPRARRRRAERRAGRSRIPPRGESLTPRSPNIYAGFARCGTGPE